ncbi:hypothetical protein [Mycolicibacterium fortuitum]|uniref:hypothetical protein n=1 Tax=Mycolicibacterium fortuitum TaxID=1766 RepID=UPI00260D8CB4|nr:hypothetical protein [Mycolicibacterium fortuitum]
MNVDRELAIAGKFNGSSDFTTLDAWTTLTGEPLNAGGLLAGEAVLRFNAQALTDSHKATVKVGQIYPGKTRLWICSDVYATVYYGLEIETGLINNKFHIIKGRGTDALLDGYIFSEVDKFETTNRTVNLGDDCSVWYDEPNHTIRAYHGAVEVCALEVDPYEIPHGAGNRYHGVAIGVDLVFDVLNKGMVPTSYTALDV